MKKRLIKKIGYWCDECNRPMKIYQELKETSPYVGDLEVKGKYPCCPVCKTGFINYSLAINEEKMKMQRASELLLKNFPPDKYEYLSEEEVFKTERKKQYDPIYDKDETLLKHLRFFVFNIILEDNKRIYLKKSFDLYQHNWTGWFDITKPEKPEENDSGDA